MQLKKYSKFQVQRPDPQDIINTHLKEKQVLEGEFSVFPTPSKRILPSTTTQVDNVKSEMEDDPAQKYEGMAHKQS